MHLPSVVSPQPFASVVALLDLVQSHTVILTFESALLASASQGLTTASAGGNRRRSVALRAPVVSYRRQASSDKVALAENLRSAMASCMCALEAVASCGSCADREFDGGSGNAQQVRRHGSPFLAPPGPLVGVSSPEAAWYFQRALRALYGLVTTGQRFSIRGRRFVPVSAVLWAVCH